MLIGDILYYFKVITQMKFKKNAHFLYLWAFYYYPKIYLMVKPGLNVAGKDIFSASTDATG